MLQLGFDLDAKMFHKIIQPALDWTQLEITAKCNAQCIYCPHLFFRETRDTVLL